MPWTGSQFSDRHNHALHGAKAEHAAHIANAVLKSGAPEGESIAIANKWALRHRDSGGSVGESGIGGVAPSSQSQNPLEQGMIQRYTSMPIEQLTELAARLGGTPQGQIIQRVLMQKRTMPQPQQQQQGQQQQPGQSLQLPNLQPQAPVQQARGGTTPRRAMGGDMGISPSQGTPWWTRAEARSSDASGYLHGATAGRADNIQTTAPGGAYVLPADVIAGLGRATASPGRGSWIRSSARNPMGSARRATVPNAVRRVLPPNTGRQRGAASYIRAASRKDRTQRRSRCHMANMLFLISGSSRNSARSSAGIASSTSSFSRAAHTTSRRSRSSRGL